ncbi:MAG: 50S ribosomal protein L15e [Candidatus Thermoplasmatota archaeon]
MVKSMYDYVGDIWKKPDTSYQSPQKNRLIQWRQEENFLRVDRPLRIDRARSLGYKAKQGFIIVRARVRHGGLHRHKIKGGRKPSARGTKKLTMAKNTQRIAEERTAKRFPNMEVLNSYWVGEDGSYHYYEVILVDPAHPSIINDPNINWISAIPNRRRVLRGKTSAGQKGRGLRHKGKGAEKVRPSIRAHHNKGK